MDVWKQVLDILAVGVVAILAGVLPLLTKYLILFAKAKIAEAETKLEASKPQLWQVIQIGADIAVAAAEQMKLVGKIEEKFEYAFEILQFWLADHGIEVDVEVIEAAIEAAVREQFPPKE